jgi:phytoene dehydrogenase-like protein
VARAAARSAGQRGVSDWVELADHARDECDRLRAELVRAERRADAAEAALGSGSKPAEEWDDNRDKTATKFVSSSSSSSAGAAANAFAGVAFAAVAEAAAATEKLEFRTAVIAAAATAMEVAAAAASAGGPHGGWGAVARTLQAPIEAMVGLYKFNAVS